MSFGPIWVNSSGSEMLHVNVLFLGTSPASQGATSTLSHSGVSSSRMQPDIPGNKKPLPPTPGTKPVSSGKCLITITANAWS